ncbi:glycosyltransferase family 2 protein [Egbenema bharatensis]|uniref:glycosyltransferase family 2 protein n=1 Tax=Egbenema bharatensis TaxID=3463334 RepID=UPI003A8B9485
MSDFALNNPSVLVVIVNYRTSRLVVEGLRSLKEEVQAHPSIRVAIVDNESGDDSLEYIQAAIVEQGWGDWATLIPSGYNGGYAYGNNLVIRPALQSSEPPDYCLLLNPDTTIRPGAVWTLVEFMEKHPEAGICGSGLENPDGSRWPYAFRFPSILSELDGGLRIGLVTKLLNRWVVPQEMPDHPTQIDWLPGASMMVRRQVFADIGLMDEEYFLYYEETDFCLQAQRSGWECWYVPESRVMHIAGQSTGVTVRTDRPKRLPTYWFESRRRYFTKNYGWLYAVITDMVWMLGFMLWRLRRVVQRKPDADPPHMLVDFFRNSTIIDSLRRLAKPPSAGVRADSYN